MSVKILYEALRAFENKEFDVADKRLHEAFRNIMKKKLQETWDASDDALEDDDFTMDVAEESAEDADLLDEIDDEMIGESSCMKEASCVKEEDESGWEDLNLNEADESEEVDQATDDLEQEMEDESEDDSMEDKIEDEFDDLEELFRELVGQDSEVESEECSDDEPEEVESEDDSDELTEGKASNGYVEKRGPKWVAFDDEGNQIGSFATRELAQKALV